MLPVETNYALFPRREYRVGLGWWRGSVTLRSATLRHAAVMEKFDCGLLNGGLTTSQALMAAWVLSLDREGLERAGRGDMRGAARFVRRLKGRVAKVCYAVFRVLEEASLPFIPPKQEDGGGWKLDDGLPNGCGWVLEVAEALCAHYGWRWEEAMDVEVGRAFALLAVSRTRTGGEHGDADYYGRIRLRRMKALGLIPKKPKKAAENG